MSVPTAFVMPPLPAGRWLDDAGCEIPFGRRWGMEGPPEDAYSRVTHPERYAPLHRVADALVAHLLAEYDCVAEEDATEAHETRAVRMRPAGGPAFRMAWTSFPGVCAALGGDVDEAAPLCGCDACDEALEPAAAQFCDRVLAFVARGSARWPTRR
ncbi:DUF6226 family protein [Agrococcus sp. Ld7]|uniref:DUF6226 family protein n=1 Tax=Agrococcus sp. Ld7 TaxID=649148 RepID=UPI0038692C70